MKKLLIGLALIASATSQAQTSTATTSTSSTSALPQGAAAATNPANTSTMSTTVEQNNIKSRFGANFIVEASAGVGDLKENSSRALIDSYNAIGLTYKISDTLKTELRHNYQMRVISDREQLKIEGDVPVVDPETNETKMEKGIIGYEDPYKDLDPTLHLNWTTPFSVFGSKPLVSSNRYYIPTSEASRDSKTLGTLRMTQIAGWDLNPRWTIESYTELRLYMNTTANKKAEIGSDSQLRYLFGPVVTYNLNDKFSAYYFPYFDLITTGHQRGNFGKADQRNDLYQEAGVNVALGSFTINPYLSTKATRVAGSNTYEGFGADAESSYNLLVQAVF